jgi:hypothetical protein
MMSRTGKVCVDLIVLGPLVVLVGVVLLAVIAPMVTFRPFYLLAIGIGWHQVLL